MNDIAAFALIAMLSPLIAIGARVIFLAVHAFATKSYAKHQA